MFHLLPPEGSVLVIFCQSPYRSPRRLCRLPPATPSWSGNQSSLVNLSNCFRVFSVVIAVWLLQLPTDILVPDTFKRLPPQDSWTLPPLYLYTYTSLSLERLAAKCLERLEQTATVDDKPEPKLMRVVEAAAAPAPVEFGVLTAFVRTVQGLRETGSSLLDYSCRPEVAAVICCIGMALVLCCINYVTLLLL